MKTMPKTVQEYVLEKLQKIPMCITIAYISNSRAVVEHRETPYIEEIYVTNPYVDDVKNYVILFRDNGFYIYKNGVLDAYVDVEIPGAVIMSGVQKGFLSIARKQ